MNRINIYTEVDVFEGWFDLDAAEEIASYRKGDPYVYGKILLVTKKGKLVINVWTNTGKDFYRFAKNEDEIAEILAYNYEGTDGTLLDILKKYEI